MKGGQKDNINKKDNKQMQLPKDLEQYIPDPRLRKAFVAFSKGKIKLKKKTMPNLAELMIFNHNQYITTINDGRLTNPSELSLSILKVIRKDPIIQLGLKVIKLPIKSMKWWIECQDKNIAAFLEYAIKRVWKQMLNVILNAVDFGWSASEKIWEEQDIQVVRKENGEDIVAYDGPAFLLKKLKDPDPSTIDILVDSNGDFNGIKQFGTSKGDVTVNPDKCFVMTNEKEYGNLYGKSLLRYAYDPWYWSTLMYQFLNRYFERRGTPPIKARAPKGKATLNTGEVRDNLEIAQTMAASLNNSSAVALPSNIDEKGNYIWDVEYMREDQRAEMFIEYIEHLNIMKLRALFVPERAVIQDTDMGARSVAQTHLNVFLMALEGLMEDIADHINKYLIPQLINYNFGPNTPPAYIKMRGLSDNVKNLLKQILIAIIKKGEAQIPVDLIRALEDLGLPVKREEMNVQPISPTDNKADETESKLESWRETEQFYRYRIRNPNEFIAGSFRTTDFNGALPEGVKYIRGKLLKSKEFATQAVIFNKRIWNLSEAKRWVKNKDFIMPSVGEIDGDIQAEKGIDDLRKEYRLSTIRKLLE